MKFTAGQRTVTSHSKTDAFGRKVFDELQFETGFASRQFSYHVGQVTDTHAEGEKLKSAPTTQLVERIILSDGRILSYEYDPEERITKVTDSVEGVTEYTYDTLGQLLTETQNGEVVNEMTYDNYGNILTKNGEKYTYGDVAWRDRLTAVDGKLITYDAQGNPTNYFGYELTWEKGRQLKSFEQNSYTYNANGIRTSKTVNGVTHTYTLDETNILKETWGDNELLPMYDNEDNVCGIIYNDSPFYFLKNLQGDVIALVDKTGKVVASYSYDAWGVCTIESDISGCNIAMINPYRYRSYYYDTEIGMYYLQSRYYDPSVGRFVNGDVIIDNRHSLGLNLFAYCWNNPINLRDLMGYYTSALTISAYLISALGGALASIMTSITASMASIKAAIATSWLIPVCVAATTIAIVGIVNTVRRLVSLSSLAVQIVSAVKAKAKNQGISTKNLKNYTVYIIVRKYTIDVVYVGITKNYPARKNAHKKRFPTNQYTMMPVATGLSKAQARAMEQTIITAYGLDTLKNMINSISPKKWSNFKQEFEQMQTLIQSWKDPE